MPRPPLNDLLKQVATHDAALAHDLSASIRQMRRAADSLAWATRRLPALRAARTPSGLLAVLIEECQEVTGAPSAWAVSWEGRLSDQTASFQALVRTGDETENVPAPGEISRTIVGEVVEQGEAAWTEDAQLDERFAAARSVRRFSLRSVGCVPIGSHGVLYLLHPDASGFFRRQNRLRVEKLCDLAETFLAALSAGPDTPSNDEAGLPGIVGTTPAMLELFTTIRAFAPMPWPALVLGESGSGKELVARALHQLSPRAELPFQPVNCGAIPENLAESHLFGHERGAFTGADRRRIGILERVGAGTLFLDEVGELPPAVQVKLLRLLQEGTFERVGGSSELQFRGRVVAATLRPLQENLGLGSFRHDLYHRLAGCVLKVPPLSARRADIPALARHLLDRASEDLPGRPHFSLAPASVALLSSRAWPGNVRELGNALRFAIAHALMDGAQEVRPEHFAVGIRGAAATTPAAPRETHLARATDTFQRGLVGSVLNEHEGNRTRAAKALGVSRQWLHKLLSRWAADDNTST